MTTRPEYYTTGLYPFQDGILEIVRNLNTPFYLTGGTALSRCYFHHRHSDDLDFFVNADVEYPKYVRKILQGLKNHQSKLGFELLQDSVIAEDAFSQVVLRRGTGKEEYLLKIDMINDVPEYFGEVANILPFGRVDNVLNILTNKLSALYRFEPKDIADVWIISRRVRFRWKEMLRVAKEKELGLDVLKISEIIKSFPSAYIDKVRWAVPIEKGGMMADLNVVAEDLLWGRNNSLAPSDSNFSERGGP